MAANGLLTEAFSTISLLINNRDVCNHYVLVGGAISARAAATTRQGAIASPHFNSASQPQGRAKIKYTGAILNVRFSNGHRVTEHAAGYVKARPK